MTSGKNRQLRFKRYIMESEPVSMELFELGEEDIPTPGPGQFLVKTEALGTSPAQRAYLMGSASRFHPPLDPGEIMRGRGVGRITLSNHPDYRVGEAVCCSTGWQDYSVHQGDETGMVKTVQKIADPQDPLYLHLGTLGASAFAAYFGLLDIGQPRAGETVVVSAAAGGVGSIVAQIARIKGCRVVGIAGGSDKCAWLTDFIGADAAIDYKSEDLDARLAELCPTRPDGTGGIDIYFDNVGGETLNMALKHIALRGRAVICGLISTEYVDPPPPGPSNYFNLIYKRARMQGLVVWDYVDQFPEAEKELAAWYRAGDLKPAEYVLQGLTSAPDALQALFSGANRGITVVDLTGE